MRRRRAGAPASMKAFKQLAIESPDGLLMGCAPNPVRTRSGLAIGEGAVLPELNFTLPVMAVDACAMPSVLALYREVIEASLKRAVELEAQGLVVEFETLPPMTENPDWAVEIVRLLLDAMEEARVRHGLKTALRVTPNDNRAAERPPLMRSGPQRDAMLEVLERSANEGAELLSIESVGGKEVSDEALMEGDFAAVVFAVCVLGVRDMRRLWADVGRIAQAAGAHAAGDSACAFANTAMVLAERKMISKVFAAAVRAVSAVRSLAAYECGAVGPGKDCAYENVILKAITGFPMSMEGKAASCAHGSPVGNVAAAACDLWSNESVQSVRLLGGLAPVCSLEQLVYDCRLFNEALADGSEAALQLRDWLVRSDARRDPQALLLAPASAIRVAGAIVGADSPYRAGLAGAREALDIIREAREDGILLLGPQEALWEEKLRTELNEMPEDEGPLVAKMLDERGTMQFRPEEYDLG